tara:strand:- start:3332 stop:5098 length:1767 start_codon:yes stop_codon:yes gene_type:complete
MSVLNTLTEGIRQRSLANEGEALLKKWEKTGLLEGLDDHRCGTMSRLLENQAAQLLKETSTMQSGDVEGFAAVAFPIVRRVFGNLLAQDLVSVQPMSLPSGLIFFLDFTFSGEDMSAGAGTSTRNRLAQFADTSIYGGGRVGSQITGGVNLAKNDGQLSAYTLNNGYASPTGSNASTPVIVASGVFGDPATSPGGTYFADLRADPAFTSGSTTYVIATIAKPSSLNEEDLVAVVLKTPGTANVAGIIDSGHDKFQVRRLTKINSSNAEKLDVIAFGTGSKGVTGSRYSVTAADELAALVELQTHATFPIVDAFTNATALGAIKGTETWGLENNANIPQIDIKVDSVAVTAVTKKLKAKWSPELAQDLNAYHNLDAEVELTSILSEQVALEIDQEILEDLVKGASAGTLFWSRSPGKFLNRETGSLLSGTTYPDFTGTVSEWYETLLETVNEVSARIHRRTLRGGANFLVCSPEVANILEFTSGFRASVAVDEKDGSWGVQNVGSISRKMDIHVDPYFTRNLILVGRKGNSFLESGYVYAPYVPLQVTPTIFGTEDFVPRKGVMTRYAKKMVRPDMYGLVVVADLVSNV